MSSKQIHHQHYWLNHKLIIGLTSIVILVANFGFWIDEPVLATAIPIGVFGSYLALYHIKTLFNLLFFFIPLSMELELPGGVSTDLIGEPILWVLTLVTIILLVSKHLPKALINRISALLGIHLIWIMFAALLAVYPLISLKYFLAKCWYILPFYVLPFYVVKNEEDIRTVFKFFCAGVLCAGTYFFVQHFMLDLTYLSRTNAGQPIWRNHVNYACTLVIAIPLLFYLYKSSAHPDRWLYLVGASILLFFIYFAYARIAYLCLFTSSVYYLIVKCRLTKFAVLVSCICVLVGIVWLQSSNRYLDLAPHQEAAIMQLDFERKLSSTITGEDISTMERVHRWVAGYKMIKDNPWTGVGPANFYSTYRPYSIYSFETYVSANTEHSGIHNYYLMVLVEQGYIGLFIFISILFLSLSKCEDLYHSTIRGHSKSIIMTAGIVLVMIITINTVNDMIEVIKIGGMFFFILSLIQINLTTAKAK